MKIETERLILRPFREEDLDDELSIIGDADTMSFYRRPYSREEVVKIIAKNIETFEASGYGMFAVIDKNSGEYLGDCGITIQLIDGDEEFEVGYRIRKEKWGQGLAPEAARAMVAYGFKKLDLTKLCSYMTKDNLQSRRAAEKAGMTFQKEYRDQRNRDLPTTVYAVYSQDEQADAGKPDPAAS